RMYGSDARHSLEPADFVDLTRGIQAIATMLAHPTDKDDLDRFRQMKQIFQKSVATLVDITPGTVITRDMLGLKKPGSGIPAAHIDEVVGRRAARAVAADNVLAWSDLEVSPPETKLPRGSVMHA
ncbi:MAG: SAF domain-containing protein, partial [Pirellulaceae bacterium]